MSDLVLTQFFAVNSADAPAPAALDAGGEGAALFAALFGSDSPATIPHPFGAEALKTLAITPPAEVYSGPLATILAPSSTPAEVPVPLDAAAPEGAEPEPVRTEGGDAPLQSRESPGLEGENLIAALGSTAPDASVPDPIVTDPIVTDPTVPSPDQPLVQAVVAAAVMPALPVPTAVPAPQALPVTPAELPAAERAAPMGHAAASVLPNAQGVARDVNSQGAAIAAQAIEGGSGAETPATAQPAVLAATNPTQTEASPQPVITPRPSGQVPSAVPDAQPTAMPGLKPAEVPGEPSPDQGHSPAAQTAELPRPAAIGPSVKPGVPLPQDHQTAQPGAAVPAKPEMDPADQAPRRAGQQTDALQAPMPRPEPAAPLAAAPAADRSFTPSAQPDLAGAALSAGEVQARTPLAPHQPLQHQPGPSEARLIQGAISQIDAAVTRTGPGTVEVSLSPKELGQVAIRIEQAEGALRVAFTFERAETTQLMRAHQADLAAALTAQGYSSLDLSFADRQAPGRQLPAAIAPDEGEPGETPPPAQPVWRSAGPRPATGQYDRRI